MRFIHKTINSEEYFGTFVKRLIKNDLQLSIDIVINDIIAQLSALDLGSVIYIFLIQIKLKIHSLGILCELLRQFIKYLSILLLALSDLEIHIIRMRDY